MGHRRRPNFFFFYLRRRRRPPGGREKFRWRRVFREYILKWFNTILTLHSILYHRNIPYFNGLKYGIPWNTECFKIRSALKYGMVWNTECLEIRNGLKYGILPMIKMIHGALHTFLETKKSLYVIQPIAMPNQNREHQTDKWTSALRKNMSHLALKMYT